MALDPSIHSLLEFWDPYFDSENDNQNHSDPAPFGDNGSPEKYSDKVLEVDR